jgi:hypothetical protein
MSDNPNRESAPSPFDQAAPPTPLETEGSGDKRASTSGLEPAAFAASLIPHLTPAISAMVKDAVTRQDQSFKDRRLKSLDGVPIEFFRDLYNRAQKNGGDVDAAMRDVEIDAVRERVLRGKGGGEEAEGPVPGRTEQPTRETIRERLEQRSTEILDNAGIDPKDEAFLGFVAEHRKAKTSPDLYEQALEKWAWRESRQRAITEGQASLDVHGKPPDPKSVALQKDYDVAIAKVERGDINGLQRVKVEFRQKGLKV